MELDKFKTGIAKTGFDLEYRVSEEFRKHRWSVINNKYYIDDVSEQVREVDLVAYKADKVDDYLVYTTLIVSCKKDERNVWALLGKPPNYSDPNIDRQPLHVWSNDVALAFMLDENGWRQRYLAKASKRLSHPIVALPKTDIFAFQEMNSVSGNPNNDRNIFGSISSLMKAQAYELIALPDRKKNPVVYQFNLLTVVDADMIRLDFNGSEISAASTRSETYIANYIVAQRETFARIHFLVAGELENSLPLYDDLHQANREFFHGLTGEFYRDCYKHVKKRNALIDVLRQSIWWRVSLASRSAGGHAIKKSEIWLNWDEEENQMVVTLDLDEQVVAKLNLNSELRELLAASLKEVYRFEGKSAFAVDDIPF